MPSFTKYGETSLHNRKELLSWLDKIIDDTQRAHNFHLVSDDEDVLSASVAPGSPVNLPTFITFRSFSHIFKGVYVRSVSLPRVKGTLEFLNCYRYHRVTDT